MDTVEESRLCRDERKLNVLPTSRWSVSVVLLSLFLCLEKMDRPPDDCLDLSAEDIFAFAAGEEEGDEDDEVDSRNKRAA